MDKTEQILNDEAIARLLAQEDEERMSLEWLKKNKIVAQEPYKLEAKMIVENERKTPNPVVPNNRPVFHDMEPANSQIFSEFYDDNTSNSSIFSIYMPDSHPRVIEERKIEPVFNNSQILEFSRRTERNLPLDRVSINNPHRNPSYFGRNSVIYDISENYPENFSFSDENYSDSEEELPPYEELLELDAQDYDKGNGFKVADLQKLKKKIYRGSPRIDDPCSICLNEYKPNDWICSLPCTHIFHEKCIKNWLSRKKTCTICKTEVKIKK